MTEGKRKLNEKELDYDEVEHKLKTLGSETFGSFCNPDNGKFIYPKQQPIIITVVGGTGSGKTTFIKNTFLTTIPGFSGGQISVLYLQHAPLNQIQEKLKTLHYTVNDLTVATYENWITTIQRFVDSKKLSSPKLVILDDFTNLLNQTKTGESFRHLLNTYHNHKNTSYIIVTHTATAENAASKTIAIIKKETTFLICSLSHGGRMLSNKFISQFPSDIKELIKKKIDIFTLRFDQAETSHVMINLTNGTVFDDNLTLITI